MTTAMGLARNGDVRWPLPLVFGGTAKTPSEPPFPELRLTRLPGTLCFFVDRPTSHSRVLTTRSPHPPTSGPAGSLASGFPEGCHPAFLSRGSLEIMENVELLPSSARQHWCPAAPSTSWHRVGVVSLLSPGSPVPQVGKAGPYLRRTVTWWQQLSHVHCVTLPQE